MNNLTTHRIHDVRSLYRFCVESVTTCLSINPGEVCVPIALFALSALLLATSCFVPSGRQGHKGEVVVVSIYGLLGNLCSTTGAFLSPQLDIQIVFGVLAVAVDVVNVVFIFLTLYMCWNSAEDRRLRSIRRRRRQHLVAVCLLVGLGGYVSYRDRSIPAHIQPSTGRKLCHAFLQDNTELLGYILGLVSLTIACTSRFPAISRACRRERVSWAGGVSAVLSSAAGLLYASGLLLLSDLWAPGGLLFKAAPWLLSALCSATLDLLVLIIFCWRKGARWQPERISLDTQNLLAVPHFHRKDGHKLKKEDGNQQHALSKKNVRTPKTSEVGHYMDISVRPGGKVCLTELSARDAFLESCPPNTRAVRLVQVELLSSSYDSSSFSSDLEWDFEGATTCWREPPEENEEDVLQDWPKNPPQLGSVSDFTEMSLFP